MRIEWIDGYLLQKAGVTRDFKPEWNWTRYMVGDKLFCALCHDAAGAVSLISLKLEPLRGEFLRAQFEDVIPGYYMNKVHWNSVKAQGNLPEDLLEVVRRETGGSLADLVMETSGNPDAVNGSCKGIMQVSDRWHYESNGRYKIWTCKIFLPAYPK